MASANWLTFAVAFTVVSVSIIARSLESNYATIMSEYWKILPTKEGYYFEQGEPNGFFRTEMGKILNPGTDKEETVIEGYFRSFDPKTGLETKSVYTADKNGFNVKYKIYPSKFRVSIGALKSAAG